MLAYGSIRQHASAYGSIRQHASAYGSIRQHTAAYVSIFQHASAYVSIRQHASAYGKEACLQVARCEQVLHALKYAAIVCALKLLVYAALSS